jgi:hypothetical protein
LRVVRAGLAISLVRRFVVCFREADQLSLAARALMEHLVARGHPGFR